MIRLCKKQESNIQKTTKLTREDFSGGQDFISQNSGGNLDLPFDTYGNCLTKEDGEKGIEEIEEIHFEQINISIQKFTKQDQ